MNGITIICINTNGVYVFVPAAGQPWSIGECAVAGTLWGRSCEKTKMKKFEFIKQVLQHIMCLTTSTEMLRRYSNTNKKSFVFFFNL